MRRPAHQPDVDVGFFVQQHLDVHLFRGVSDTVAKMVQRISLEPGRLAVRGLGGQLGGCGVAHECSQETQPHTVALE